MGKTYERLDQKLRDFIDAQHMFFIATAPRADQGLINLSPKGLDSLRVLDDHTVAYLDLTGSGVETVAHLKENGRFVLMFCAFEGPPRIVRLHGRGEPVVRGDARYDELAELFPSYPGMRSIIVLHVQRVADSCGFAVPRYDYVGERDQLLRWAENKGTDGLRDYQRSSNLESLDGLPGLAEPTV